MSRSVIEHIRNSNLSKDEKRLYEDMARIFSQSFSERDSKILQSDMWSPFEDEEELEDCNVIIYNNKRDLIKKIKKYIRNGNPTYGSGEYCLKGIKKGDRNGEITFIMYFYNKNLYSHCLNDFTDTFELYSLQIPEEFRGQHLATEIIQYMEYIAKKRGYKQISVRGIVNPIMGKILKKQGFNIKGLFACKSLI